jgi:uncharacterized membrane protein YkvA (DUF1232 family)
MTQMTPNPTAANNSVGILGELIRNAQLVWRLLKDPRVSLPVKLIIPGVVGLYLLSPIDFMPDLLPLLGQIDDIAVLFGGVMLFLQMCPPDVVAEHRAALAGEVKAPQATQTGGHTGETVDAEYRVIE